MLPLMRLRYGGSAARWGFAIYLASSNGYQDSILPTGTFAGSPQDAGEECRSPPVGPDNQECPFGYLVLIRTQSLVRRNTLGAGRWALASVAR
ncbi:MAG: hypothetical protein ACRDS0_27950 [Pseudonocardiaceae bacterium]